MFRHYLRQKAIKPRFIFSADKNLYARDEKFCFQHPQAGQIIGIDENGCPIVKEQSPIPRDQGETNTFISNNSSKATEQSLTLNEVTLDLKCGEKEKPTKQEDLRASMFVELELRAGKKKTKIIGKMNLKQKMRPKPKGI